MKFFLGAPEAGLAAPLSTAGIKGSVSGLTPAAGGTDDQSYGGEPEFAYAPSNDDGNAPTTDDAATSSVAPATDDGGAGGSFRRLEEEEEDMDMVDELAPFESMEVDVVGERPGMEGKMQRGLKGVLVSTLAIPPRLST